MEDRAKTRALLEEHHAAAWGWALCCCSGDREMAEDILHDVYLKILEAKAPFAGRSSFQTWLFSIIRRTAFKNRTQVVRRLEKLTSRIWASSTSGAEIEEGMYRSEVRRKLDAALEALSRRQREVLHLVFYQEMTVEDAAEVMQVSVGSARTHYHRGKDRLRKGLMSAGLRNED